MKNTTDELTQIEHQLAAVWVAGDHTFHERILADDSSVIDPAGRVLSKAQMLEEVFTAFPPKRRHSRTSNLQGNSLL